jgi:DNA modification methylase
MEFGINPRRMSTDRVPTNIIRETSSMTDESHDRVELRWPGKYVDGQRAQLLDRGAELVVREAFGDSESGNRLIRGDNLLALEALVRRAPGSVALVYIDPPFATGNRFALARRLGDKREGTEAELRLPAFDDAWDGGLAGFLRMLDPRLRLIHRLLAATGSLYVHVDPTVGHAVKLLLDEVFGPECFQREIVWRIGWVSGFKSRARNWIRNHDLIFYYTKDPQQFTFNKLYVPHPAGYERRAGEPAKVPGVAIDDVWNAGTSEIELTGRESLDSIQIKSFSREKTGWATQKNESLLRRIISASSNPGDIVADLFAGSGTTAVVAAQLGRQFLVCDHADAAVQIARGRLLEADVAFERCELDGVELAQRLVEIEAAHGEPADTVLRRWLLAQLGAESAGPGRGADSLDLLGPLAGRRGDIGLALGLPGEPVTHARVEALLAAAREQGLSSVELLAFEWGTLDDVHVRSRDDVDVRPRDDVDVRPRDDESGPALIPVQVGRGLFEASVREPNWCEGGVAVWERPKIQVSITQLTDARVRVELVDMALGRKQHLPAPLRERGWADRVLGWSLADASTPTRPCFVATRRGLLPLVAEVPARDVMLLAIEDICGHRHVRRLHCK